MHLLYDLIILNLNGFATIWHNAKQVFWVVCPEDEGYDGYYVAYKPITLSSILFMFVEMKFIHCHSCVMFAMKSMSMCND